VFLPVNENASGLIQYTRGLFLISVNQMERYWLAGDIQDNLFYLFVYILIYFILIYCLFFPVSHVKSNHDPVFDKIPQTVLTLTDNVQGKI